jgi:hypothetical protein
VKVLAIAVGLSIVAACGGGSKAATTTAASTSSSATTAGSTTIATTAASTTTAAPSTTGASTTAVVDDKTAITNAIMLFFDMTNPDIDAKVAVLENGEKYRTMISDTLKDPVGSTLSTKVTAVDLLADSACPGAGVASPCAKVTHDLYTGDLPALLNRVSYAIKVGGKWVVAAKSWCDLVKLQGQTCPA